MDHVRHSELFDCSNLSITLIGCGGIGAITAVTLAKMGVGYMTLYDDDTVDDVNLATQFHQIEHVGRPKVYALQDTIELFADDTNVECAQERIGKDHPLFGQIIISAVDSIQARKDIWIAVKRSRAEWYIDARMAAEEYRQYAVHLRENNGWNWELEPKKDVSWYENLLAGEDDATALQEVCTAKATFYTACIAAGHIGAAVKGISVGEPPAKILTHNIRKEVLFTL